MVHNNNLHFVLVTFPAQGHINPSLQFANRLIHIGAQVTFSTSLSAHRRMLKNSTPVPDGLTLAPFSDGWDDGFKPTDDVNNFMSEFERQGSEYLRNLVSNLSKEGRPVTSLIYTLLLPWAGEVALDLQIPSTLLWIQPATVFDIYYYYFGGYSDVITASNDDPSYLIELPGLPSLSSHDIPSFFLASSSHPYTFVLDLFKQQFQLLERENERNSPINVLVNTFDALEPEALTALGKVNLIGIGPLVPSAFLYSKDPSDTSFRGDLFDVSKDNYIEWLNSKKEASVVYVSFGSIAVVEKRQMEEIATALVESGRPFLWVIRTSGTDNEKEAEDMVPKQVKDYQHGLIVQWCSQVQVLTHPSVGCFVSHCGWNSSLESLVAGVPMVAFPQWTDQGTNAKLIQDMWKTGVRVKVNEDDKVLESDELKRCLELVMDGGPSGEEMRTNAKKWKDLAKKVVEEGGSSEANLRSFVQEFSRGNSDLVHAAEIAKPSP